MILLLAGWTLAVACSAWDLFNAPSIPLTQIYLHPIQAIEGAVFIGCGPLMMLWSIQWDKASKLDP